MLQGHLCIIAPMSANVKQLDPFPADSIRLGAGVSRPAATLTPSCLVLDVGLPGLNGLELQIVIAGDLGLSAITVKAHRGQVMRKMKANSLADLVTKAARLRGEPQLSKLRRGSPTESRSACD
jgi:Bacterial regulatory proteins, luxR family